MILFMLLIMAAYAQDDVPVVDDANAIIEHPIVLNPESVERANDAIIGWLEQDAWAAPAWLNATVNLTRNVTRA